MTVRRFFLILALLASAFARAGEPIVDGPNCPLLFEMKGDATVTEFEGFFGGGKPKAPFFSGGTARRGIRGVDRYAEDADVMGPTILDTLQKKDWKTASERLQAAGFPVKADEWQSEEKKLGGFTFDLGEGLENLSPKPAKGPAQEDLLVRALRRLRNHWNGVEIAAEERRLGRKLTQGERETAILDGYARFPEISIVDDDILPKSYGNFQTGRKPVIQIQATLFEEYLRTGDMPRTLAHELRHAGFNRFERVRLFGGKNFYSTEMRALKGKLSSDLYETYVSLEEPYNHLRDLRKNLLEIRVRIAQVVGTETGALDSRAAATIQVNLTNANKWNSRPLTIATGVKKDLTAALTAALNGDAPLSVPMGGDYVTVTHVLPERTVEVQLLCPTCGAGFWGKKQRAKELITVLSTAADERLAKIQKTLEETKATFDELSAALESAGSTNGPKPPSGKTVLERYDQALKKVVRLIQTEPKFTPP